MTARANIFGGRELEQIRQQNPLLGNLLNRMLSAITNVGATSGVSPVGLASPPPKVGAVNVKASGEQVHVTIDDAAQISKPIEYFVEHDTNPNFTAPHVVHLVSSRGTVLTLPTMNDSGVVTPHYFRAYSQTLGSKPSPPVYFGGLSPTAVTLTGSTRLTLLASTGSGTASPRGGQGGWGRGKVQTRPSQGTKRAL